MIRAALLGLLGVQAARPPRPAPVHAAAMAHDSRHAEDCAVRELGRQVRKAEVVRERIGRALIDRAERTDRALGEVLDVQRGDA